MFAIAGEVKRDALECALCFTLFCEFASNAADASYFSRLIAQF